MICPSLRAALLTSLFLTLSSQLQLLTAESDLSVRVEVDRAFATIGDRINFRVTTIHKPEVTILEISAEDVLRDFEVKGVTNFSTRQNGDVHEGKNYAITSYELGEYIIRPLTIQYRVGGGEVRQVTTDNLYVTIESIDKNKDPESDIRGVKGARKLKSSARLWVIMIAFLLGIGGLLLWQFRQREGRDFVSQEPPLSPDEEAYQAISELRHSDWLRKGQVKLYFFRLSEILRRYFERRYQIRALESTTYELMTVLKNKESGGATTLIEEVLSFCDLVKFAKYDPPATEILHMTNQAKLIIDRTRQEPQNVPLPIA